jgi:hypothetical protein
MFFRVIGGEPRRMTKRRGRERFRPASVSGKLLWKPNTAPVRHHQRETGCMAGSAGVTRCRRYLPLRQPCAGTWHAVRPVAAPCGWVRLRSKSDLTSVITTQTATNPCISSSGNKPSMRPHRVRPLRLNHGALKRTTGKRICRSSKGIWPVARTRRTDPAYRPGAGAPRRKPQPPCLSIRVRICRWEIHGGAIKRESPEGKIRVKALASTLTSGDDRAVRGPLGSFLCLKPQALRTTSRRRKKVAQQ